MQETLERIGLTSTESRIYLALLDLGESKVSEILKKGRIRSGRIYEVLDSLEVKGFVSKIDKKGVKYYIPSPPSIIKNYLNEKKEEIAEEEKRIEKVFPDLMSKYSSAKEKTTVEVFTGINGLKTSYDLLFEEAKKDANLYVLGITSKIKYPKSILNLLEYYVYKKRKQLKLNTRKIIDSESRSEGLWKKDNSEIRYLPLPSLTSIEILGDCVAIQLFQEEDIIVILVRNKRAADDFKKQFMIFWNKAKR